ARGLDHEAAVAADVEEAAAVLVAAKGADAPAGAAHLLVHLGEIAGGGAVIGILVSGGQVAAGRQAVHIKRGAAAAAVKVVAVRGHLEGLGGAVADGTLGSGRALRGGAEFRHQAASASTVLPLIRRLPSLAETLITAPSVM